MHTHINNKPTTKHKPKQQTIQNIQYKPKPTNSTNNNRTFLVKKNKQYNTQKHRKNNTYIDKNKLDIQTTQAKYDSTEIRKHTAGTKVTDKHRKTSHKKPIIIIIQKQDQCPKNI